VCFLHRNGPDSLHLTLSYIHHSWLPQAEFRLACKLEQGDFRITADPAAMAAFIPLVQTIGSEKVV